MKLRRRQNSFCWRAFISLIFLGFAIAISFATTNALEKLANSDCLDCHTDPANKHTVNGHSEPLALFSTNGFARSVHSQLDCVDCHDGIKEMVHDKKVPPPNCAGCHEKEAKDYAASIHGMSHQMGASGAAQCWDCHGSHEMLPVRNPTSPVYKLNLPATCAKYHSNTNLTKEYQIEFPEAANQYMDSIHGNALLNWA